MWRDERTSTYRQAREKETDASQLRLLHPFLPLSIDEMGGTMSMRRMGKWIAMERAVGCPLLYPSWA